MTSVGRIGTAPGLWKIEVRGRDPGAEPDLVHPGVEREGDGPVLAMTPVPRQTPSGAQSQDLLRSTGLSWNTKSLIERTVARSSFQES
jgi:hypothetical protein